MSHLEFPFNEEMSIDDIILSLSFSNFDDHLSAMRQKVHQDLLEYVRQYPHVSDYGETTPRHSMKTITVQTEDCVNITYTYFFKRDPLIFERLGDQSLQLRSYNEIPHLLRDELVALIKEGCYTIYKGEDNG
jgi:hypothetical protein